MKYIDFRKKIMINGPRCFTSLEFQRITGAASKVGTQKLLERYTSRGIFTRLKNGLYALSERKPSEWAIANRVYAPSYISTETALSHYGIIPETIYAITSVTSKITRNFTIGEKNFVYRKIKLEAFSGYLPIPIDDTVILIAEPEKAIADFIYFVFLRHIEMNERIRWPKINRARLLGYIKSFGNRRFERWSNDAIPK